jgi:uncharacterized protein YjbJ (UPF0337 family)
MAQHKRRTESGCAQLSNRMPPRLVHTMQHPARRVKMGEFTEKVKGETNEAIGNVKQESGNPETRAEGRDQETKGEIQEEKGEVVGALGNVI